MISGGENPNLNKHTWELVMQNFITRFVKDESGATAIEYGLIAALISVGIITAAGALGNNIANKFNDVSTKVGAA